ncbi:hypothetical protein GWI33_006774 [Rhynchophorus ferrugineus]|uniref:Ig-like domain-containing protein n=1 Tax=Rhynchophorus ferrugineus TaxID=354439 RepID=A0A834IIA3_RHYFE|nr:hypothetical protein GWI33_006774 [Rhynchophorus ferrugineus]
MELMVIKWFILVTCIWDLVSSLKITNIYVPNKAETIAHLNCQYDLEGEPLYDVKWYKDEKQFYRCLADGTTQEFEVPGVKIDKEEQWFAHSCPVTLVQLSNASSGRYRCEVSLDAPTFRAVSDSASLVVINRPPPPPPTLLQPPAPAPRSLAQRSNAISKILLIMTMSCLWIISKW